MLRPSQYDRRWRPGQGFVLLICLCFTAYFAYHAFYGRYGFEARFQFASQQTLLDFEIKSLEAVRSGLERDLKLLASEPPHPDIVDDIARAELGFAHPRDRIILNR